MRAADLTTALVLIAGGLLVLWDSLRLGVGWGTDGPKSGFFPFWLALIAIASCVGIAAQAWMHQDRRPFIPREAVSPVLKMLGPAAGFVLLVQLVGFYTAAAVYMAVYMRWIGRYPWLRVIAVSLAFPVVTFVIFETWFLVPMPKGPIEALLGY
jgi:hypothetical protein